MLFRSASGAVGSLVGQTLALAACLSTALKFRGTFSIQAKSDGAVDMLLADCTDTGELRGYARCDKDMLDKLLQDNPNPSATELLGTGYLAFIKAVLGSLFAVFWYKQRSANWYGWWAVSLFLASAAFAYLSTRLSLTTVVAIRRLSTLERKDLTKALTGMHSRQYLDGRMREELVRADRHGLAVSVLLLDLDDQVDLLVAGRARDAKRVVDRGEVAALELDVDDGSDDLDDLTGLGSCCGCVHCLCPLPCAWWRVLERLRA